MHKDDTADVILSRRIASRFLHRLLAMDYEPRGGGQPPPAEYSAAWDDFSEAFCAYQDEKEAEALGLN